MQSVTLRGKNVIDYGPPANWDEKKYGPCAHLSVHKSEIGLTTFYQPDPDEMAILNTGGAIQLTIMTEVHPVIMMGVARFNEVTGDLESNGE